MPMTPSTARAVPVVDVFRRRALHGLAQDGAVNHARHLHVDAVLRGAVHLARHVDPTDVLADQAELRLRYRFHLDLRRLGRDRGESSDLAVGQSPARLLVQDHSRLRRQLCDRNPPVARSILDQHVAHLGAELPQAVEVAGDGRAARGVLLASKQRIPVELAGGICRHDLYLRPVGVHLVGHDARQRGERSLAHLGRRRHDGDSAVGMEGNVGVDDDTLRRGRLRGRVSRSEDFRQSERNAESEPGRADHEAPTIFIQRNGVGRGLCIVGRPFRLSPSAFRLGLHG